MPSSHKVRAQAVLSTMFPLMHCQRSRLRQSLIHIRPRAVGVRFSSNRRWLEGSRVGREQVRLLLSVLRLLTLAPSIGTTKRGIGPAYSGKASRSGLRVHHLFDHETFATKFRTIVEGRFKRYGHFEYDTEGEILRYKVPFHFLSWPDSSDCGCQTLADRLRPYVIDSVTYIHDTISAGKRVLVEGANALMLDLDFGTYPFVTSSSTSIGGVCTGLGIPPKMIGKTIGVMKAYTTRVGGGPFPTEQLNVLPTCLCFWASAYVAYRTSACTSRKSDENTELPPDGDGAVAGSTWSS